MPNKKTRALSQEDYIRMIKAMETGSYLFKPNPQVKLAMIMEANIGTRISDVLLMTPNSFVRDGSRYRLDISEEKTGKSRHFTVPVEIYRYVMDYCKKNGIQNDDKIIQIKERAIQAYLSRVAYYLDLDGISTHSFRKFFATEIYVNNNYDLVLVQRLLQHSSPQTTLNYIDMGDAAMEKALQNHIYIPD